MGRVIAEITSGDPPFRGHDLVADPVEKGAVVADHDQGRCLLLQVTFEPLNGFHIQVVRGLVEQQ